VYLQGKATSDSRRVRLEAFKAENLKNIATSQKTVSTLCSARVCRAKNVTGWNSAVNVVTGQEWDDWNSVPGMVMDSPFFHRIKIT
jgi:hypothetical protein